MLQLVNVICKQTTILIFFSGNAKKLLFDFNKLLSVFRSVFGNRF